MRTVSALSASFLLLSACVVGEGDETDNLSETGLDIGSSELGAVAGDSSGKTEQEAHPTKGAGAPQGGPVDVVGSWVSPFCGERSYARTIRFDRNGRFAAQDLVSPCPPDVVCFWSGIVENHGKYEVEARLIELEIRGQGGRTRFAPFPTTLQLDAATSAPAELTPEGKLCVYKRISRTPKLPSLSR